MTLRRNKNLSTWHCDDKICQHDSDTTWHSQEPHQSDTETCTVRNRTRAIDVHSLESKQGDDETCKVRTAPDGWGDVQSQEPHQSDGETCTVRNRTRRMARCVQSGTALDGWGDVQSQERH